MYKRGIKGPLEEIISKKTRKMKKLGFLYIFSHFLYQKLVFFYKKTTKTPFFYIFFKFPLLILLMNEKFLIGLKKTHEIEQEILKITDFPLHNTINPCSYNEKISLLDQLYEETAKMINDLNILILEMRKNLEIKDEIRGIWEMYLLIFSFIEKEF